MGFLQTLFLLLTSQGHLKAFEKCVMKRELVASSQKKDFLIEILASKQLCVVNNKGDSLYPYAGLLKITNTSNADIEIVHNAGSTASFSFRAEEIYEDNDRTQLAHIMPTGPIDAKLAKIITKSIAPNESYEFLGYPQYIYTIPKLISSKKKIDGSAVVKSKKYHRIFNVDFITNFKITTQKETLQVSDGFKTTVEVFAKD